MSHKNYSGTLRSNKNIRIKITHKVGYICAAGTVLCHAVTSAVSATSGGPLSMMNICNTVDVVAQ